MGSATPNRSLLAVATTFNLEATFPLGVTYLYRQCRSGNDCVVYENIKYQWVSSIRPLPYYRLWLSRVLVETTRGASGA